MLTDGPQTTNATAGVMLSIADLARRDGVAKPTVSIAVKKLVEKHGLHVERDRHGRVAKVNTAQYDLLRERTADPSKAQAPRAPRPEDAVAKSETYDESLRLKTLYAAERERLRLAQDKGELVPVARVAEAGASLVDVIVAVLDRLPAAADDIAASVARDGSHGARAALKKLAASSRSAIADAAARLAERPNADRDT